MSCPTPESATLETIGDWDLVNDHVETDSILAEVAAEEVDVAILVQYSVEFRMHFLPFLLVFLCSVFQTSLGIQGLHFWKIRRLVMQQIEKDNLNYGLLSTGFNKVKGFTMNQLVDNFEVTPNPMMYKQRYWMNKAYWRSPDGPVLLYVGGESALSGYAIAGGHIVDMAKEYGALLFAVEHRYYGKSTFKECLQGENMRFLSSQQALADLANFVAYASDKFGLTEKNKWISYGGSYPGSLSAWFRLKYPHLVSGSVASSAPVEAKTNFEGYNNVVASSLSSPLVGGSEQCLDNIHTAFETIDKLLDAKQFKKLQKDFISCNDISNPNDTYMFAVNMAGLFMGIVQYNNVIPTMNISSVCKQMMNASQTPYENMVYLNKMLMWKSENCTDNSYKDYIDLLKKEVVNPSVMMRQWIYQTCTQFGYYQTCDPNTKCVFSKRITLMYDLDTCQDVFGITPDQVKDRVAFTNDYYGSNKPKGSRIVFVNGSIDPWHWLSVLKNQTSSEVAIFIPGTAHCANMGISKPTDPPALKEARKRVSAIVGKWLKEAESL